MVANLNITANGLFYSYLNQCVKIESSKTKVDTYNEASDIVQKPIDVGDIHIYRNVGE